jgi:DNA-binding NtrC family response regulator
MSRHAICPPAILLVGAEPRRQRLLKRILTQQPATIVTAATAARAVRVASSRSLALVILEDDLPDARSTAVLQRMRRINPGVPIVVVTGLASIDAIRAAMELGASDYLPRPFDRGNFEHVVQAALAVGS